MMKRLFVPCFYLWCFTVPAFAATQIVPANNDDSSTFSLAIKPAGKKKITAKEKKVAPAPKEINLLMDDMHFEITRPQEDDWFNKIFHEKNTTERTFYTVNLTPNKSDINSVVIDFFPVAFKKEESTNPFATVQPMLSLFTIKFF